MLTAQLLALICATCVEVTSVSRHEQSLSQTAAAIFFITEEDIQRSSATNIPDLLRMVPSVHEVFNVHLGEVGRRSLGASERGKRKGKKERTQELASRRGLK
jgi:outer membrane receptor for ferrienterochelin and colicin